VAAALGLPQDPKEIRTYLSGYTGVGVKTAQTLIDAFGPEVFDAMDSRQEEIGKLLGDRRARTLLDQWTADRERRTAEAEGPASKPEKEPAAAATEEKPKGSSGARRGSRGRGGRKKESTPTR